MALANPRRWLKELAGPADARVPASEDDPDRAPRAEQGVRRFTEAVARRVGECAAGRPAVHGIRQAVARSSARRWGVLCGGLRHGLLRAGTIARSRCGNRRSPVTCATKPSERNTRFTSGSELVLRQCSCLLLHGTQYVIRARGTDYLRPSCRTARLFGPLHCYAVMPSY